MRSRLVALLCAVVIGSACGGGAGRTAGSASSTATLKVRDQAALLKPTAGADFGSATDGQGLALGDTVRTNGTGFAQVDYKDGSLTRLDANAEFTLTDLSTAAQTQRVAGTLDSGRAWSNVQKVTSSDGRYEIDTSVATASVRGTKFNVDCAAADGSCTYTVVEGTVTVTPKGGGPVDLGRGQSITVRPDGSTTTVETKSPTQLLDDPWIAKNVRIDAAEARPSSASSTDGGSAASATVQYTGVNRAEAVRFVCRPGSGCAFLPPVTPVTEVPANGGTYHFTRQIDLGEICITSAGPKGHEIIVETWDLTPSTTTTQLKGVDVPAHMNGTHVTETIEVPNCLAADRREASIDSGPEPG